MTNLTLLLFGLLVFVLMLTGLVLTMIGFHAVADRPDRVRGLPDERGRLRSDAVEAGSR